MRSNVRALDPGVVEVAEVIDYRHARTAVANQAVNEMASDKPGSACHENVFHLDRTGCVVQTSLHRSECQELVTANQQGLSLIGQSANLRLYEFCRHCEGSLAFL